MRFLKFLWDKHHTLAILGWIFFVLVTLVAVFPLIGKGQYGSVRLALPDAQLEPINFQRFSGEISSSAIISEDNQLLFIVYFDWYVWEYYALDLNTREIRQIRRNDFKSKDWSRATTLRITVEQNLIDVGSSSRFTIYNVKNAQTVEDIELTQHQIAKKRYWDVLPIMMKVLELIALVVLPISLFLMLSWILRPVASCSDRIFVLSTIVFFIVGNSYLLLFVAPNLWAGPCGC